MDWIDLKEEYIIPYKVLGVIEYPNGTIKYGHFPEVAPKAYLITVFAPIGSKEIKIVESALSKDIPLEYARFLSACSNGLNLFITCFSLYGYMEKIDRRSDAIPMPFSLEMLNRYERPRNSKDSFFFIGGYNCDGSKLYIDIETGKVHYCKRNNSTSLYCWESFDAMLISEMKRLTSLFDEAGRIKVPYEQTLPV